MKTVTQENGQVVITDSSARAEVHGDQLSVTEAGKRVVHPYNYKMTAKEAVITYAPHLHLEYLYKKDMITYAYKKAGDYFGCSASKFAHILNAASYDVHIKPNEAWHNRFGTLHVKRMKKLKKGCISKIEVIRCPFLTAKINAQISVLKQYEADNMSHLAGYGLLIGEAEVAKKTLGKGAWKNVCKNSKSRNDLICRLAVSLPLQTLDMYGVKEFITYLNKIPTTLLNKFCVEELGNFFETSRITGIVNLMEKFILHIAKPLGKIDQGDINRLNAIVSDTARMVGTTFSSSWSISRIIRAHDEHVKQLQIKVEADAIKEFELINNLPNLIQSGAYKAIICKTKKELWELGNEQHHCVGGYADFVESNQYVVYKIVADDEVSTLGIAHPKVGNTLISQHYGVCNSIITDEHLVAFARQVKYQVTKEFEKVQPKAFRF